MQNSNCPALKPRVWRGTSKIQIESAKLKISFWYVEEKIAQKSAQIYPKRESTHSPGGFGFERARKINF